jgi:hypothetical protein
MADSNSHKLGQFIGDTLEMAIEPHLVKFAATRGLFLDKKGARSARPSKKLAWTDFNGNAHGLDFVLERNGSEIQIGAPVAFIEIAWRRYTKHSRAKAQEIQGAIEPLYQTFRQNSPFKGALLAGVFTSGALDQLDSLGFKVVYVSYDAVVAAFQTVGIDVSFDEDTPEESLGEKVDGCQALTNKERRAVAEAMLAASGKRLEEFFKGLQDAVERKVVAVRILALFGSVLQATTIEEAVVLVKDFVEEVAKPPFNRYEIRIDFSNGDFIEGQFQSKKDAIAFLNRA